MKCQRGLQHGFTLIELLVVIVLAGVLTALVVIRIPSTTCTGVDTAAQKLASDMRLAKSLAQNELKDYSIDLLTTTGTSCYSTANQYAKYQIIDKSDGSVYRNDTNTFDSNVVAMPGVTPPCGCGGGTKCEQEFVFASDGTEGTKDSAGAPASGNKVRVQSTSQKGCQRNYDISVEPTTGSVTIAKNGP